MPEQPGDIFDGQGLQGPLSERMAKLVDGDPPAVEDGSEPAASVGTALARLEDVAGVLVLPCGVFKYRKGNRPQIQCTRAPGFRGGKMATRLAHGYFFMTQSPGFGWAAASGEDEQDDTPSVDATRPFEAGE